MAKIVKRRPNAQPASFEVSPNRLQATQKFNEKIRYSQGYRANINNGENTIPIKLSSSGREMLGIAIIPTGTSTDINDCQIGFVVNNNNLLTQVAANNLNPAFVQGMIFFPTPQPLNGNDTINVTVTKNNAGTIAVIVNVFYVPQI